MGIKKVDSPIALIFGIYVKFLDLLFFNLLKKSTIVSLTLALPLSTIFLLLALNAFKANFSDNPIIFNIEVNNTVILLKL